MKIFTLFQEPANYTLDLIRHIHVPKSVDYAFIRSESEASDEVSLNYISLDTYSFMRKITFLWGVLCSHDAIILNGYTGWICFTLLWMNILIFRKPVAIDSDTELRIPSNRFKRVIKGAWLHFLFTRSFCYGFAGGNFSHRDLFRYYGMKEERIFLMPMMVDNERYIKTVEERRKPSNERFRFGYLGRLVKHKQIDCLILALRKLIEEGIQAEMIIIGEGSEKNDLVRFAKGLPVSFLGPLFGVEKIRAIHSIDCLLLNSSYEPWGLVVNEALASGIPVIVSNRVGARKDLVEGEMPTGLVVKWDDMDDLVTTMKMMVTNQMLRQQFGENASKRMRRWSYSLYEHNFDLWIEGLLR